MLKTQSYVDMSKFAELYPVKDFTAIPANGHVCDAVLAWFGARFLEKSGASCQLGWDIVDNRTIYKTVCAEERLYNMLRDRNIHSCLEIGTYLGMMALLLARLIPKITTIDTCPRTDPYALWNAFGVTGRIDYFAFCDADDIPEFVGETDFDLAYIDGDHSYEGVKRDFEMTRRFGRVLFHDYFHKDEIKRFIDTLPSEELFFCNPFVLWEAK